MKKYIFIILFILIGVNTIVFSQTKSDVEYVDNMVSSNKIDIKSIMPDSHKLTDANITGHVLDAKTGEHIPYAVVVLDGTTIGGSCDATGHYFFKNLPLGDVTVKVQMTGYCSEEKKVNLKKNNTLELNFSLKEDAAFLDQVVVSANRTETKRRNSPSLVSIVNDKMLAITASTTLADGLVFQPGVRTEDNCQNCGFTQVRINGLDGHYSQILMDSRPIFSALTGVYGLEQIPSNMIDRIEVVRGGGSALFGSSAIGGTVNIITKEPMRNSASLSHQLMSIGMSGSVDNNTTMNASVISDNNKMGLTIYGQRRVRDTYDENGDGFSEVPKLESNTIGFSNFMRLTDYSKITLQYHGIKEFRRGGDRLGLPAHESMIAEQIEHNINGGNLSYDLFSKDSKSHLNVFTSFQNTRRKSYYGSHQDPNAYGRTHDLVSVSGAQFTYKFDKLLFMPSEFVVGVEHKYNDLHDVSAGYNHDVEQIVRVYSSYIQNEWKNDHFGFLLGGRFDKHNLLDKVVFSPRVNFRYNPSKAMNFRLSYASGFRAPQAFDEDFHIAVVGGERVVTVLADNLKQENSQSYSLSGDFYHNFNRIKTNLSVEGFYTNLDDVFSLRSLNTQDSEGNDVLERYNGFGAVVYGTNVEGKVVFPNDVTLQAGVTVQKSEYDEAEQWSDMPGVKAEKRLFRSPNLYGYCTLSFDVMKKLECSFSGTYTGEMIVQHMAGATIADGSVLAVDEAVETPDFFDLNVKLSYHMKVFDSIHLEFNGGLKNIFDSYQNDFDIGADRDSGYVYGPSLPRSVFAGLKINF